MGAEHSLVQASDSSLTAITTNDDMSSVIIPDRRHPRGLRAFPPEIRVRVFKFYYAGTRISDETHCDLLVAFQNHDDLLYKEAVVVFYSFATVATEGFWSDWNMPDLHDDLPKQCQWVVKEGACVPEKSLVLVKNLRINTMCTGIRPPRASTRPGLPNDFSRLYYIMPFNLSMQLSKADLKMGIYFDKFSNISNLTLNLSEFLSHCWSDFHPTIAYRLIYPLLSKFTKLSKLSIELKAVMPVGLKHYDGHEFFRAMQDQVVQSFEDNVLEVVTAALSVFPKMGSVRASSLQSTPLGNQYVIHAYGPILHSRDWQMYTGFRHDVLWFWEVEGGKSVTWNMEKAIEKSEAEGFSFTIEDVEEAEEVDEAEDEEKGEEEAEGFSLTIEEAEEAEEVDEAKEEEKGEDEAEVDQGIGEERLQDE